MSDGKIRFLIDEIKLTTQFFHEIGRKLSKFSKICVLLEGGYSIDHIGSSFTTLLDGLVVED